MKVYAKDLFEAKCQLLIKKSENTDLKHSNDFKVFIEYLNDMDSFYQKIEEYNPYKKSKL